MSLTWSSRSLAILEIFMCCLCSGVMYVIERTTCIPGTAVSLVALQAAGMANRVLHCQAMVMPKFPFVSQDHGGDPSTNAPIWQGNCVLHPPKVRGQAGSAIFEITKGGI